MDCCPDVPRTHRCGEQALRERSAHHPAAVVMRARCHPRRLRSRPVALIYTVAWLLSGAWVATGDVGTWETGKKPTRVGGFACSPADEEAAWRDHEALFLEDTRIF